MGAILFGTLSMIKEERDPSIFDEDQAFQRRNNNTPRIFLIYI